MILHDTDHRNAFGWRHDGNLPPRLTSAEHLKPLQVLSCNYRSEGFPRTRYFISVSDQLGELSTRRCRCRRRRRRQLVSPGGYRFPGSPPCLITKGAGLQNVRSHTRMLGTSVFPDSQVMPECVVLQYSQLHRSNQNAWSFSISRFTGHTRMLGPLMPNL